MFSLNSPIVVFVLVTLSISGLLLAVFQPQLSHRRKSRRMMALALSGQPSSGARNAAGGKQHKRSVEDTLREIAEQRNARFARREKSSLSLRLRQAGLAWSVPTYWGISALIGLVVLAAFWFGTRLGPLPAAGVGAVVGLILPHFYVGLQKKRRLAKFSAAFPDAVDSIVRGVKSGMPVSDCLRAVASSAEEPVRTEFKLVIDNETLGMPVDEAVQRMAARIPTAETQFLAVVITVQKQSGGNLTEALDNLSVVLRARKKMLGKIRAMSSEAKASAWIIGSLPVVVCFFVYLMNPDYIGLLFTTGIGNLVLAACGSWMLIGVLVMRKMINFDF